MLVINEHKAQINIRRAYIYFPLEHILPLHEDPPRLLDSSSVRQPPLNKQPSAVLMISNMTNSSNDANLPNILNFYSIIFLKYIVLNS